MRHAQTPGEHRPADRRRRRPGGRVGRWCPGRSPASLSARSPLDQGIVTGLSTGLHYLLTVGTQDALQAAAAELAARPVRPRGSATT